MYLSALPLSCDTVGADSAGRKPGRGLLPSVRAHRFAQKTNKLHARADTTTKCELGCNPKQRVASHHNRKSSLTLLIRTLEGHKHCIGMRMTISHLPSSNSREHDLAPHVQQHIVIRAGNRMCSLAGLVWCWSLSCVYPFFKNGLQFTSGQVVRYSTRLQRRLIALRPHPKDSFRGQSESPAKLLANSVCKLLHDRIVLCVPLLGDLAEEVVVDHTVRHESNKRGAHKPDLSRF